MGKLGPRWEPFAHTVANPTKFRVNDCYRRNGMLALRVTRAGFVSVASMYADVAAKSMQK